MKLEHLAMRAQFDSAIWGIKEIHGLLLQKSSKGWYININSDELEDESSSPFCYHPDAERIWEALHKQRFKTRKDALEAIQIAREIRSQDYLPASSSSQQEIRTSTVSFQWVRS